MKKRFTLILASMFLTIGAWAQTSYVYQSTTTNITASELNEKKEATYISIKGLSNNLNGYFVGNSMSQDFSNDAVFIWEPTTENTAGTYYIKDLSGQYMQNSNPKNWGTIDNAAKFYAVNAIGDGSGETAFNKNDTSYGDYTTQDSPNNVRFVKDGTSTWINLGASAYNGGTGAWTIYYVYSVSVEEVSTVNVTYEYVLDGDVMKSVTVEQTVGSAYEAPAVDYITFENPTGTATADATVQVTCTQNLPFTVSTDYASATWYYMTIRSNDQKYVARSESAPYTNSKTITVGDNGLWAFIGNAFDGIQVINKGAGDGFTLGCAGTATASDVSMAQGETTWTIEEGTNGFVLGQGENVYAHDYSSKLQIWNDNAAASDAGSAFNVFTVEELTNTKKNDLQTLINQADAYEAGTAIGCYTEASVAGLVTPLATANSAVASNSLEEILNATTALQAAIDGLQVVLPTLGKFYRFKHPSKDAYMLSDVYSGNAKYLAMGALEANKVSSIFYYGEDGTLLSYANGRYLSDAAQASSDWTCLAVGSEAPEATFGAGSAVGTVGFYLGTDASRAYYSARETYVDAGGSFGSNSGYDWVVEEVASLPVTIGTAGYATLHAPVALTVPTDVTAYTGALNDTKNVLTLTAINAGETIPANTAVILEGTANTYDFAITTAEAFAGENALSGTVEAEAKNSTVYTLQSHNGGVAFKQYTGENLNGFRSYLVVESNAAIRITRGGDEDTTGIGTTVNGEQTVVIYDLAGRRVEKMEKGIYIVNGKKVIR